MKFSNQYKTLEHTFFYSFPVMFGDDFEFFFLV